MGQGRFLNQKLGKRKGFAERRAKKGTMAGYRFSKAPRGPKDRRATIKKSVNQ
jgi:hypothetical protein